MKCDNCGMSVEFNKLGYDEFDNLIMECQECGAICDESGELIEDEVNIKYTTVVAREDFIDQHNKVRLIQGMEYKLRQESEDDYTIIDETGEVITLSKRYFYD